MEKGRTKVFVQVPHYWAFSETMAKAFDWLRRESGKSVRELKAGAYFALEFPADAKINVSRVDGSWGSDKPPVALLGCNKLKESHEANLRKLIKK